jgi:RHS repeat-associated protein
MAGFEIYREFASHEVRMERETLHIMNDKQRIALVETTTIEDGDATHAPTPEQRYQLANHLGSASVEVDEAGGLITYEEYSPYGNTTYQAGISAAEVRRKRYRYTGMERDGEGGLNYHRARYYAPWLGRWISPDPDLAKVAGWPAYAYCFNNPLGWTDTSGRSPDFRRERELRRLTQETRQRIGEVSKTLEEVSDGLRKLNSEAKEMKAKGATSTQIENRLDHSYAELNRKRNIAVAEGRDELKASQQLGEDIRAAETQSGRTISVDPELGGNLGEVLKNDVDKLRQGISKAEALNISVPRPPKPPSPPKDPEGEGKGPKQELPEARVVKREESLWGRFKKFIGFGERALEEGKSVGFLKGALETGAKALKFGLKWAPVAGAAIMIASGLEHLREGRYARAAVDFAEAIPIVGDVVLAGDLTVQYLGGGIAFFFDTLRKSPGSLFSGGLAAPFVLHGGYGGLLRSPSDAQRELNSGR